MTAAHDALSPVERLFTRADVLAARLNPIQQLAL